MELNNFSRDNIHQNVLITTKVGKHKNGDYFNPHIISKFWPIKCFLHSHIWNSQKSIKKKNMDKMFVRWMVIAPNVIIGGEK